MSNLNELDIDRNSLLCCICETETYFTLNNKLGGGVSILKIDTVLVYVMSNDCSSKDLIFLFFSLGCTHEIIWQFAIASVDFTLLVSSS